MRICIKQYVYRSRVLEQLIDDYRTQEIHGGPSAFITAVIPDCIDVGAYCWQSWEYLRELLRADPNGDEVESVGKLMKSELPRTLAAFDWIQEMVASANRNGVTIENTAAICAAASQVREVYAKIEMLYPQIDHATAEESIAEFKRGECITVEQLIEELTGGSQGVSVPTH